MPDFTRDDLFSLLTHDNFPAFLRLIRRGETDAEDVEAYQALFGWRPGNGKTFSSFEDHPRVKTYEKYDGQFLKNDKIDYTTAAGAYQFTASTWDPIAKQYGLNDFGPTNQDLAALALIRECRAVDDIREGRILEAIRKCSSRWASLPGANTPQPQQKIETLLKVFTAYGGTYLEASQPVPAPASTQPAKAEVKPMPIFMALLPSILQALPQLAQVFGTDETARAHNTAAISVVSDALVKATQSPNLQAAVESLSDPAKLAAAQSAINDVWGSLVETGGGGIDGARKAALVPDGDWKKVVFTFPFMLCVAVLPLVYAVVGAALVKQSWLAEFSDDARMMVITAVINLILGSIIGYVYGQSMQQKGARSTDK